MSNNRKMKRTQDSTDTRPTALLIGGPFDRVQTHLNSLPDVVQMGHDVDHIHRYGKMTDPDTGAYLGCYSWLDPADAEA